MSEILNAVNGVFNTYGFFICVLISFVIIFMVFGFLASFDRKHDGSSDD